ncbi:hypothetical protein BJ912DRAFT_936013 [Pholiota molesta]|nr:hypothetical protein BJ912DRAFT_936013 [Pholiota molesta]
MLTLALLFFCMMLSLALLFLKLELLDTEVIFCSNDVYTFSIETCLGICSGQVTDIIQDVLPFVGLTEKLQQWRREQQEVLTEEEIEVVRLYLKETGCLWGQNTYVKWGDRVYEGGRVKDWATVEKQMHSFVPWKSDAHLVYSLVRMF